MNVPRISPAEAAEELLRRNQAKESLYEFVKQAWPVIEPGYRYVDGWHIQAICEHLEAVFRGEIRNLLINIPPRALKTLLTGVAFPAWTWINRPTEKFVFASYSYSLAEDASIKCRSFIRSEWFQARWGDLWQLQEDRDTKEYYANTGGGERIIASVDGTLTGRGGDVLVGDDLNNTKDQSEALLNNTLHFWKSVVPTRLNEPKTGRKIVVQQRVHERDVTGHIIANEKKSNWVKLILPLEFETKRRCITVPLKSTNGKPWFDPRTKEGESLIPERWGPQEITVLKEALGGEYAIAGQLQQRPAPAEGGIIKKKWFQQWKNSAPPKLEYTVLSIDTALSEKKAAAYNAATTWGVFKDENNIPNVILLGVWRKRCEYPELRDRIKRMARNYLDIHDIPLPSERKPDLVLIERKSSGISLIQDLAKADVMCHGFDPTKFGDKTQRVRLITPLLEAGRVWVPMQPPLFDKMRSYADTFVEQCGTFPNAESRDIVDTMTQVLLRLSQSGWVWVPGDRQPSEGRQWTNQPEREAIY